MELIRNRKLSDLFQSGSHDGLQFCSNFCESFFASVLVIGNFTFVIFLGVSMNLRPLHDRIIVKRLDQETKTASGIVLPDAAAEKPDQGEVLAVGNGKVLEDGTVRALEVKVGDRVLFGKYSGQAVKVDGNEVLVMREEDVFAIVQK
jgi:chaperonin GroES